MAWRSWSASAGVKPATSMAICMSCSWNSGTPSVFFSDRLEQRVEVGDLLLPVAAPDVGVHRPALDGAGADERHLDHQVVERAGPQPGQRGHLGPGLHLEHPDRVGPAEHVVDLGPPAGGWPGRRRRPVRARDEVDAVVEHREHPEAEQVELHQADGGAVVLVPLEHACGSPCGPTRPGTPRRPAGRRSPCRRSGCRGGGGRARARRPARARRRGCRGRPGRRAPAGARRRHVAPAVDLLRPGVLLAGGVAEGLGDVADRRAAPGR